MNDFLEEAADFVSGVFETVEKDVEELFPPRPGGKVDSSRKDMLRQQEYQEYVAAQSKDTDQPLRSGKPYFRTLPVRPNIGGTMMVTLSSVNPVAQILPVDYQRTNAVILAVDNDVYITADQNTAYNVEGSNGSTSGFYLPAGIAIPIDNQAQYWVAATTTATSSRVSVIVSKDAS